MSPSTHRSLVVRAVVASALLISGAAIGQYALDHSLDANPMVGGTGYNPQGRGNAGSLRSSSYRLDRRSGEIRDTYGANSAFARPEYRANAYGETGRAAYARAGLTRDQIYPSYTTTNLRRDDVQQRMSGKAYSPNDPRAYGSGGLQAPTYQPYASTSYANPGAVGGGPPAYSKGKGLQSASTRVPAGSGLGAPSYKPGRRK